MHAAIARGGVRLANESPPTRLLAHKTVSKLCGLGHDEQRKSSRRARWIGVRARQNRENIGATGKSAPGLRPLQYPAGFPSDVRALGAALDVSDVAADVGLGHGDRDHELTAGNARQPNALLRVRSARQKRFGQNLGSRDERACSGQRRAGQLFSRYAHRLVTKLCAAVFLGY